VTNDFPTGADIAIIVDTSSKTLMSKTIDNPAVMNFFTTHPVIVLDHHVGVEPDLPFEAEYIFSDRAVATGELIYTIAKEEGWAISPVAATDLFISIQADSLGLSTESTTADSFETCASLVRLGASPAKVEEARRELMKKSPRILSYKGKLIERIDYLNDGRTAFIHIPFEEIHEYSNEYNPTMLVIDEMRQVTGVDVAIGIKTYPDDKLTGKIRSNIPVSNLLAKRFGGDGHPYAAGFRTYAGLDDFLPDLTDQLTQVYREYDAGVGEDEASRNVDDALAKAEQAAEKGSHASLDQAKLGSFRVRQRSDDAVV
jgi:phosphoesterase, DHHA1 (fragment)